MKNILLLALITITGYSGFTQSTSAIQKMNKALSPQEIFHDGKPDLEYMINNKIIALDHYDEKDNNGSYIRMKFKNKEVILKFQTQTSSKFKRVYSNKDYTVTFFDIQFGSCAGEGSQNISGKLLIQSLSDQYTTTFNGSDGIYSSKKCQEIGNGK